jgi:AraC-like DNA-binding protein
MHYRQYTPSPTLKPFVRYFWSFDSYQSDEGQLQIKSFADRYPRFIFQDVDHFAPLRKPDGRRMPTCFLSGIDTKNTVAVMNGTFSHFGVSFYPHALHVFFGVDANELVNSMPEIELVCHSDIRSRLECAHSHLERVKIISQYLYWKIDSKQRIDPLVNQIILTEEIDETTHVVEVARKHKVTERQLERKFKMTVGISPKKLQRIARFERSLQLLASAAYSQLTEIAHQLDYSDQSHFIKDFSAFSGMTPYDFVRSKNLGSDSSSFICPL